MVRCMRPTATSAVCRSVRLAHTLIVMQLNDDDIREFKAIWKDEFGEEITDDVAREAASRVLELYRVLARAPRPEPDPPSPA